MEGFAIFLLITTVPLRKELLGFLFAVKLSGGDTEVMCAWIYL